MKNRSYKSYRRDDQHSYSLGVYPTLELLTYQPEIVRHLILHSKGKKNRGVKKIRQLAAQFELDIVENDKLVDILSNRGNTYAVGVFEKHQQPLDPHTDHLVLVNPSSKGNLGTIMRTMIGFGVKDLAIIEPAADPFDPHVARASMGAIFQLRLSLYKKFPDYWGTYANHHLYPLMTNGQSPLPAATILSPFALIFGEESSGLGKEFFQYGNSIRIPHHQAVDSLNLAVAVGITLYGIKFAHHPEKP